MTSNNENKFEDIAVKIAIGEENDKHIKTSINKLETAITRFSEAVSIMSTLLALHDQQIKTKAANIKETDKIIEKHTLSNKEAVNRLENGIKDLSSKYQSIQQIKYILIGAVLMFLFYMSELPIKAIVKIIVGI